MSGLYLGVELTTRAKHVCDYDRLHPGERSPIWDGATAQDEIELTLTAEELAGYGVNYVLGAALLENGKAVEYNLSSFAIPSCGHSKNFCYASAESISRKNLIMQASRPYAGGLQIACLNGNHYLGQGEINAAI